MSSRICVRICAIWLSLTVAAVAQTPLTSVPPIARAAASLPALPQVFLDTTYIPPAGPTTTVPAGGDFQAALNNAQPGSTITLQAGATYTGPFTLPAKAGAGWIYIISSAMASLPAPGNRVGPANAPQMAKIVVTPGRGPAIGAADGAGYYRFVGIEITPASDGWVEALVNFGSNATTLAQLPTHIVFDRSYIHGAPTAGGRYGVMLNVIWGAVIDSYVSGFFCTTAQGGNGIESRAVTSWNGVGPFKIENDYLEASTEVIMFGGWGPLIPNLVPSDIEVRGNHFNKLLAWQGTMWVKNLFELKNAQRVLVDGNIFEHNWVGGDQHGAAVLFTVRNQQGIAPWSIVADVTFTHNIVQHSTGAVEMLGQDYVYPSQQLQRVLVQNNLFVDIGAYPGSDRTGRLFQMTSGSANVVIDHNTAFQTENPLVAAEATTTVLTSTGFVFTNTIANNGPYGISGDGSYGNPTLTLSTYFPGAVCLDNAMPGPSPYSPPSGNFFPANLQAVGFVNYAGGDYHLAASSPYKNAGTDGKDIGADIDALNAATATALSGGGSSVSLSPILSVAPTTVSFGSVTVGGSADSSLTVTNTGGGMLTGTASTAAPFSVVSGGAFSLSGGASQTVVVRFSPTAASTVTGSVTVNSNGGTASVAVTGTGAATPASVLFVTPTTVSFGSVTLGGSADSSLTVTNTGGGILTGTVSTAAPFSVVSGGAFALSGGASQTVVVRFSPTAATAFTGNVTVTSNGGAATLAVTGTGTATAPPPSSGTAQPVVWTGAVNATVNGNSLQKTGGCDGCQDAGAVSSQALASGGGYVEFTVANTTTQYVVSMGNANDPALMGNWALHLNGSARAEVREGSYTYEADTPVAVGDVLRIAVVNGKVQYTKNGVVFYTSATAPVYPLQAKASLWNLGATVSNAMFSGSLSGSISSPAKVSARASGTTAQDGGSASLGESDSVGRRARGGALLLRA